MFLVTDSIYLVQIADGSYALNGMLDLGWPLAVVLIGVAAWQPAGSRGHARGDSSITLPTVLVRVCVVLMVYDHFVRVETLGVGLAAATLAAAVCRLVLTYRASSELMRITHKAALTDELTQLGNRAKLLRDLDVALNSDTRTLPVSSTSTASRPTRTPSVIPPATRCCTAWPAGWRWRCPRGARLPLGRRRVLHAHAMAGGHRRHERRAPSCDALSEQGEGFTITTSWGHAFVPAEASTTSNALSIADQRLYEDKAHGRVSARRESQQVLKRVLEQRDHMLGIHIDGVARLAEQTAAELGLDEADIERTVLAAELHDIGKSAIPDAILFKRGALNADEWAFMRRHTVIGERILAGAPSLTVVARIVRSTHERVDGKGYPDGLAGDEIPLAARIVFVCDAFDAMTSDRAYSAAITAELARGAARLRRLAVRPGRRRSIRARTRAIARARSLSATALSCAGHGSSPPPRILKP